MRHRQWLELVNDYDYEIHYHLGKVNKVAKILSQKPIAYALTVEKIPVKLQRHLCDLEIELIIGTLLTLTITPTIMVEIKGGQMMYRLCEKLKYEVIKESYQTSI